MWRSMYADSNSLWSNIMLVGHWKMWLSLYIILLIMTRPSYWFNTTCLFPIFSMCVLFGLHLKCFVTSHYLLHAFSPNTYLYHLMLCLLHWLTFSFVFNTLALEFVLSHFTSWRWRPWCYNFKKIKPQIFSSN